MDPNSLAKTRHSDGRCLQLEILAASPGEAERGPHGRGCCPVALATCRGQKQLGKRRRWEGDDGSFGKEARMLRWEHHPWNEDELSGYPVMTVM